MALQDATVAALNFAIDQCEDDEDGMLFLRYWREGEFDKIRRNWKDVPEAVFVGADIFHPKTKLLMEEEAARDLSARRWNAFLASPRIRFFGSAGLKEDTSPNGNYAHFGMEVWSVFGRDYSPQLLADMDRDNTENRALLIKYADKCIAAQSEKQG